MRKSTLEKTRDQERAASQTVTVQGWDGMHALLLNGNQGPVNPTQRELLYAPEEYLAYLGVVGAAKTSAGCSLMWMLLLFEPGYQALIGRKDYNDLKNTTKKRMEEMLYRLPKGTLLDRDKSAPETWYLRPIAQQESDAGFKPSTAVFMGLHERPSSYEFHGAFIDEADEVPEENVAEVHSRCRLPGKTRKVVLTFNPTDEDHFLYRDCTGLNADGTPVTDPETGEAKGPVYRVLVPKPNENSANLVGGYYNSLRRSMPPDMVARLIEGKWGSSLKGEPVYGRQFSRDFHVRGDLQYNPYEPLYLGHDFGYRKPFTFWAQLSQATGQLKILWEDMGENEEIHERAPRMMALTRMYMTHGGRTPNGEVIHWGDPAAKQHKDTGSTLAVLGQNGIQLHFLENIGIDPGIRAVRHLLTRTVGRGEPALVIHSRCRVLIRTCEAGYRYPEKDSKADASKPLKGNGYDDPADALRYLVVGLFGPVYDPRDHQTPRQAARTGQNVVLTPSGTPWSHEQNQSVLYSQGGHDFGESAEYRPDADPMNRWRR